MFKTVSTLTMFGLLAMSAAAQAQSNQPLRAQIPFAFQAQGATLPAGSYQLSYSQLSHVLTLKGANHTAFVTTKPAHSPVASEAGKVLFQCYGDSCYLAAVWPPSALSADPAVEVMKSRSPRHISFITRAVSLAPAK